MSGDDQAVPIAGSFITNTVFVSNRGVSICALWEFILLSLTFLACYDQSMRMQMVKAYLRIVGRKFSLLLQHKYQWRTHEYQRDLANGGIMKQYSIRSVADPWGKGWNIRSKRRKE